MRIAIIGAEGQLGTDLRRRLTDEVIGFDLPGFDACDEASVEQALIAAKPDVIINCAAMTDVDACEGKPTAAFEINAVAALHLARCADRLGAKLVYISTDYVFGGDLGRTAPHTEQSPPEPVNVYGASKLAGETLSLAYCDRSFIVRTCGLYGLAGARGKGGNFVETMLRLAAEDAPIRVVADQRLSPTSTWSLAAALAELIQTDAYGLLHLAAADNCTWHELAERIIRSVDPDREVTPIRSDQFPRPARRPAMSAIISDRLTALGLSGCGSWRAMLDEYLALRRDHAAPHPGRKL